MSFPQFAVSKWIGHGIVVSGKHYVNAVPDELFSKAAEKVLPEQNVYTAYNPADSPEFQLKTAHNPAE